MKKYLRPEIAQMSGYAPGEQPKIANLCKLNTNENPFPPSPGLAKALAEFDCSSLRRYPDPTADALRDELAALNGVARENIIAGNGSDDILTMIFRAFTAPDRPMACPEPTYSLYPVLAAMQNAPVKRIPLRPHTFSLPENFLEQARGANLLAMARPNAPTGNTFPMEEMRRICAGFDGMVLIDEAYADFADDNCIGLLREFENVIISRTFSKSYSLAGLRFGYAVSSPEVIENMMKLKDSYNVDALTQRLAMAAARDSGYMRGNCAETIRLRKQLAEALTGMGFETVPSCSNFIFCAPPDRNGHRCFEELRKQAVIVRYFDAPSTREYVRITVGTEEEMKRLVATLAEIYGK